MVWNSVGSCVVHGYPGWCGMVWGRSRWCRMSPFFLPAAQPILWTASAKNLDFTAALPSLLFIYDSIIAIHYTVHFLPTKSNVLNNQNVLANAITHATKPAQHFRAQITSLVEQCIQFKIISIAHILPKSVNPKHISLASNKLVKLSSFGHLILHFAPHLQA